MVYIEFERGLGRGLDSKACTRKRGVRPYTCVQASKPCARKTMHTRERIDINALSFVPQLSVRVSLACTLLLKFDYVHTFPPFNILKECQLFRKTYVYISHVDM